MYIYIKLTLAPTCILPQIIFEIFRWVQRAFWLRLSLLVGGCVYVRAHLRSIEVS